MTALYTIVFGTREQAERIGAITCAAHGRVRGRRGRRDAYTADDPGLMLWVHSTLVDTRLAMYETYVGRVEPATAEEFYEQMKVVATVFGVPRDVHPPTLAGFRSYQQSLLESGEVRVSADARAVAAAVLSPPCRSRCDRRCRRSRYRASACSRRCCASSTGSGGRPPTGWRCGRHRSRVAGSCRCCRQRCGGRSACRCGC
jgi:uncharacterized protein (DUF2236 family)